MKRHLVLVGLSGAGKSTVGREIAARLGVPVSDIDDLIVRASGRPITAWFRDDGEPAFRREEQRLVADALARPPHVVVPGAGWGAAPGAIAGAQHRGALVVYLQVDAATAHARLHAASDRPLLHGPDPAARLAALLAEREAAYHSADHQVPASGWRVAEVAAAVIALCEETAR